MLFCIWYFLRVTLNFVFGFNDTQNVRWNQCQAGLNIGANSVPMCAMQAWPVIEN